MTFSCWNIILFENFRHFFSHFFTFLIFNGRYILLANFSTCPTMFFGLSNDLSNILKWCRIAVYDGKIWKKYILVRASHIFRVFLKQKIIFWPLYFLISTCFYVLMGSNMLLLCPGSPIYYFSLLKPVFCHNFLHFTHILENNPSKWSIFTLKSPKFSKKVVISCHFCAKIR